ESDAGGRAHPFDRGAGVGGNLEEALLQVRGNGLRLGQGDAHRILVDARDLELVVQVRAGGEARAAHETDGLSLAHPGPGPNPLRESGQVRIERGDTPAMTDLDDVAISAAAA